MRFWGNNSLHTAGVLLLAASSCFAGQNRRQARPHLQQKQEPQRNSPEAGSQQRGFQPPARAKGGFGEPANTAPAPAPAATPQPSQTQAQPQAPRREFRVFGPGPHAGDWLRRNRNLPFAQQVQQLQSDPAFRKLAPRQQEQMRQQLQQFNSLSPDEQKQMLDRMDLREHLPPEQRQQENELARRYQGLPRGRQQAVRNAVRDLRNVPPQERQQWLSSPEYRTRFTDNEREIIGQALEIRPGQPPE